MSLHSIEAEQAILGAVLVNPEALDHLHGLRPDHFFEPLHQKLFDEMRRQHDKGERVTILTVREIFPADMQVAGLSIQQYVGRLATEAATVIHAPDHARHVRRYAVARSFVALLQDLDAHRQDFFAIDRALERAFEAVDILRLEAEGRHMVQGLSIGAATEAALDYVTRRVQGEPTNAVPTGLVVLDRRMSGGLMPGHLILGAGRPGSGKSTVGANFTRWAASQGFGVGFFSLEMPERDMSVRFLADQAFDTERPITYNRILQGALTPEEHQRLVDAQEHFRSMPIELDASAKLTVPEVGAKIRGMRSRLRARGADLKLVVIDYLKFLLASDEWRGNKNLQVGEISGGLKQLGKDEGVAMLLLCQLNRDVEKREDKRPILADLRDSGELEQDADVVMFFYREAYYLQNNPLTASNTSDGHILQLRLQQVVNDLEINIAKQRMGPTGPLVVYCNMGCNAVRNMRGTERQDHPDLF